MRRREFVRGALLAPLALGGTRRLRAGAARARIIIAGGGFAGSCCALELRRLDPALRVLLVDAQPHYLTGPMSNEALVGMRSFGSLAVTRAGLRAAGIEYACARITAIDATAHQVHLAPGARIAYDRLVVAPGIRFRPGVPEGYDGQAARDMPHAWDGGVQLRRLGQLLQGVADGATVAICVPAGLMRCPPAPYERASLIAQYLKHRRRGCKILIFDSNNHFPRQDVFSAAWEELYPGMIEWLPPAEGGVITRVDARSATLYSSGGRHKVALACVIPPQAPGTLALVSGLASGHGWCPVQPATFESQLLPQVHVIGDACIAGAMPKSASAARAQGLQCAAAIVASLAGAAPAAPRLTSVCYSHVSATAALAIHGEFSLVDDELRQDSAPAGADAPHAATAAQAQDAEHWYRDIRRGCFAA
jgi:NADPH-dependent 2,4-dienoyl-CoA reductase/sulfur reductase-like enzyme